jgi:hypothetical protein
MCDSLWFVLIIFRYTLIPGDTLFSHPTHPSSQYNKTTLWNECSTPLNIKKDFAIRAQAAWQVSERKKCISRYQSVSKNYKNESQWITHTSLATSHILSYIRFTHSQIPCQRHNYSYTYFIRKEQIMFYWTILNHRIKIV